MNRYLRRRFSTWQSIATLLVLLIGIGWTIAGWRVFLANSTLHITILAPYSSMSVACGSLAVNVAANWQSFVTRISRGIKVAYFASLLGLIVASVASLISPNDITEVLMAFLPLIHAIGWWVVSLKTRNPAAS